MGGTSDGHVFTDNPAGGSNIQIILSQVQAVGSRQQGNVRTVINNKRHLEGRAQGFTTAGKIQKMPVIGTLLPQLQQANAGGQCHF